MMHASWFTNPQVVEGELNNKGTSERHKTEENTNFAVHIPSSVFYSKIYIPLNPDPFNCAVGLLKTNPNVEREICTALLSVFFGLVNTRNIINILLELSCFCFILVHTWVRRVRNNSIPIYTIKNHYFTWTYMLKFLIGLITFFLV